MKTDHPVSTLRRTAIAAVLCSCFFDAAGAAAPGTPLGPLVTPTTHGTAPAIASNAAGDYVVVWVQPPRVQLSAGPIYAQRYSAAGAAVGPAFAVSSRGAAAASQVKPRIAMDDEGDFAVTWVEYPGPGPAARIYTRRFGADDRPSGADVLVNAGYSGNAGTDEDIAMDRDGDFVITWSTLTAGFVPNGYSVTLVSALSAIHARRFNASGAAVGQPSIVDSQVSAGLPALGGLRYVDRPSVGMSANGDFTVAWRRSHLFTPEFQGSYVTEQNILARRYRANGTAQGAALAVSEAVSRTTGSDGTAIASDAAGGFVVTWTADGDFPGSVNARSFNANGLPRSSTVVVALTQTPSSFNAGGQVASDAAGNYAVALSGGNPQVAGSDGEVRFFTATGQPRTNALVVFPSQSSRQPAIAMDAAGDVALTGTFRSGYAVVPSVIAQRFTGP